MFAPKCQARCANSCIAVQQRNDGNAAFPSLCENWVKSLQQYSHTAMPSPRCSSGYDKLLGGPAMAEVELIANTPLRAGSDGFCEGFYSILLNFIILSHECEVSKMHVKTLGVSQVIQEHVSLVTWIKPPFPKACRKVTFPSCETTWCSDSGDPQGELLQPQKIWEKEQTSLTSFSLLNSLCEAVHTIASTWCAISNSHLAVRIMYTVQSAWLSAETVQFILSLQVFCFTSQHVLVPLVKLICSELLQCLRSKYLWWKLLTGQPGCVV